MALAPLGFADLAVDVPSHICLFCSDDDELREPLEFLAIALQDPTQVALLFGRKPRLEEILSYIAADHRRDIDQDLRDGRIVLVDGDPDAEKLIPKIAAALPYEQYLASQRAYEADPSSRRDRLAGVDGSAIRRSKGPERPT